jgi:colanic acid/amylovoran biosynthesis glycosyltransferase
VEPDGEHRFCVVYLTARLPFGVGEPFIVPELDELERRGCRVEVVPVRSSGEVVHADAERFARRENCVPLLSLEIARAAVGELLRRPAAVARALGTIGRSRNPSVLLKNLVVLPKALWLARRARQLDADHIHAHWAGTSATVALVAGEVAGIPWSLTAHRWDIAEDNLLRAKAERACFVRAISAHGAAELAAFAALPGWSPWVLHMGVHLPQREEGPSSGGPLRVLVPARLVEKKGHVHLLDAAGLLRARGVEVQVDLAGDGPLEPLLRGRAAQLGLDGVAFLGHVSHDELLDRMASGRWDAVVLSSVVTESGELEGIPVALVEAMACGLPVIGTATGGIPELLDGDAGLLVSPGDPEALANAVERLAGHPALRAELAGRGRARVEEGFSADRVASALLARFAECAAGSSARS